MKKETEMLLTAVKTGSRWTPELKRAVFIGLLDGMLLRVAADVAGVTPERVRQVVVRMQRQMTGNKLPHTEPVPYFDIGSIKDMRTNKDYWKRRFEIFQEFEMEVIKQKNLSIPDQERALQPTSI